MECGGHTAAAEIAIAGDEKQRGAVAQKGQEHKAKELGVVDAETFATQHHDDRQYQRGNAETIKENGGRREGKPDGRGLEFFREQGDEPITYGSHQRQQETGARLFER